MILPAKGFFDLQLRFAATVAQISAVPLEQAVLRYTNLYVRFGLGRAFDAAHPVWTEYTAGLRQAVDPAEWTYRFYLTRPRIVSPPALVATFGCFAWSRLPGDRVRLHFANAEPDGCSPLAPERAFRRRAELAALFDHVAQSMPEPRSVVGASWLYNLDGYRRLFPPSYLATAQPLRGRFQHMPLWGQFLDRRGQVRAAMAEPFLERLGRLPSVDELDACFPFQVLRLEAPVTAFYEFHGTRRPRPCHQSS